MIGDVAENSVALVVALSWAQLLDMAAKHIPCGVVDTESGYACVETDGTHLKCFVLSTGGMISTIARTGCHPLTWVDGKLIGWESDTRRANILRLFVVTMRPGETMINILPEIVLPEWVDTQTQDPRGFSVFAEEEKRQLVVRWRSQARYTGGASPPQSVLDEARRTASGVARYDYTTGALIDTDIYFGDAGQRSVSFCARLDRCGDAWRVNYKRDLAWCMDAWVFDSHCVALWSQNLEGTPGLYLASLATAKFNVKTIRLSTKAIVPGKDEILVTSDGRYIFVFIATGGDEDTPHWHVFSSDGKEVGSVPWESGIQDISVVDGHVAYIVDELYGSMAVPRRRRAYKFRELNSGQLLWEKEIFRRVEKLPDPLPPFAN